VLGGVPRQLSSSGVRDPDLARHSPQSSSRSSPSRKRRARVAASSYYCTCRLIARPVATSAVLTKRSSAGPGPRHWAIAHSSADRSDIRPCRLAPWRWVYSTLLSAWPPLTSQGSTFSPLPCAPSGSDHLRFCAGFSACSGRDFLWTLSAASGPPKPPVDRVPLCLRCCEDIT
jgi:hypothetical protein